MRLTRLEGPKIKASRAFSKREGLRDRLGEAAKGWLNAVEDPETVLDALRAILYFIGVQVLTFPEIPLPAKILKTSVAKAHEGRL